MKTSFVTLAFLTLIWLPKAIAIDATEANLSADDLAAFSNVRHKTFLIEPEGGVTEVGYRIDLYKNGEVVKRGSAHTDATSSVRKPQQRFSILYQQENNGIKVAVIRGDSAGSQNIDLPDGIGGFRFFSNGVEFDDQNRLVLAFDVEENEAGGYTITEQNSTPEGAKAALVFQLETK